MPSIVVPFVGSTNPLWEWRNEKARYTETFKLYNRNRCNAGRGGLVLREYEGEPRRYDRRRERLYAVKASHPGERARVETRRERSKGQTVRVLRDSVTVTY